MNTDLHKANGNGAANANLESNPHAGTEAAARMAHELVDRVAKIAAPSEEKLRNVSATAGTSVKQSLDVARDKLDIARHKGDEVKTSVTDFIQQHPFAALGIAFGTGVLLSYLTRDSRGGRVERDDDSV